MPIDTRAVLEAVVLAHTDVFVGDGQSSMSFIVSEWRRYVSRRPTQILCGFFSQIFVVVIFLIVLLSTRSYGHGLIAF